MIIPTIPYNEKERLEELRTYGILDSENEDSYNQLTDLACQITGMPVSLISLVSNDRVWFKATTGMDICSADRELSLCSHAVGNKDHILVIENLREDPRFFDHPFAHLHEKPVVFYAGVCLVSENGYPLGTICVIDHKPNTITEYQLRALKNLSSQVMKLIELNKRNDELKEAQDRLKRKNEKLKDFAGRVSHDMKMPLSNIIVITDLLRSKFKGDMDDETSDYLSYLKTSCFHLSDFIEGLLDHYQSDELSGNTRESFDLHQLLEEIVELLSIKHQCEIHLPEDNHELLCNRAALQQILLNLIGNALKYNDKDVTVINIDCEKNGDRFHFKVKDNGMGIPKEKYHEIFQLFSTVGNYDRNGNRGNGIGLSTVKKLIENLGGDINVTSEIGEGSCFEFDIKA